MIRSLALILCSLCIAPAFGQSEVMYHIAVRDFFDSNGDGQGDIQGIQQKLEYLQKLGVNTISLSSIYQSDFLNYATDIEKINATYGTFKEYRDLIQNVHKRKMKLYQEVNLQYVGDKHLWFTDSFKNNRSAYSSYIYYTDTKNEKPFIILQATDKGQAVAVNLKNAKVAAYYAKALKYWVNPSADGNFYDGVDGFSFADVQNSIDGSAKTDNLLKEFYAPLFAGLKKINPDLQLLAVPTEKSFGAEFYAAGADRVLAKGLSDAILSFDKKQIVKVADTTFLHLDQAKTAVTYLENDGSVRMDAGKLRAQAALSFFMGGVPLLYNGQEFGEKTNNWATAEEIKKDKNSTWNYYKEIIRLRKMNPAFVRGTYEPLGNDNGKIISFFRRTDKETSLVMINLSGEEQSTRIDDASSVNTDKLQLLFGTPNSAFAKGGRVVRLSPYGVQVWRVLPY